MQQSSLEGIFEDFLNHESVFINKDSLSIRYTPDSIPHRDIQINALAKVLAPCLRFERPSNIFIYGKTGTGKTLVVQRVCHQLEAIALKKQVPLKVIYVNCKMRRVADTEYRLLAQLARDVGHNVPATGLPTDEIYKVFFNAIDTKEQVVIIVLDEIDRLVHKCGDDVLYNLTRINQELSKAKVCIIGISNDVTFTDDIDPRVKSSMNEEEMVFPPYDALQIKDILLGRAKIGFAEDSCSDTVISKCAAYAARDHGDARRALDLLRVAGELADRDSKSNVDESYVDFAEEKIEHDNIFEVVKHLPAQSQLLLYAGFILHETNNKAFFTGDLFGVYNDLCNKVGLKVLTQRRISDLIAELDMLGLFNARVISKGRYGRTREVNIGISSNSLVKVRALLDKQMGLN
ncbi:MAG: ORC1-type DNA replication protein [Candidatus Nanoarchaeia archaeon]|jgi:cell division control protein 6